MVERRRDGKVVHGHLSDQAMGVGGTMNTKALGRGHPCWEFILCPTGNFLPSSGFVGCCKYCLSEQQSTARVGLLHHAFDHPTPLIITCAAIVGVSCILAVSANCHQAQALILRSFAREQHSSFGLQLRNCLELKTCIRSTYLHVLHLIF